jgi:hypothetical protein
MGSSRQRRRIKMRQEEVRIHLSVKELIAVNDAITGYIAFVRSHTRPSQEREEVLNLLNLLGQRLQVELSKRLLFPPEA